MHASTQSMPAAPDLYELYCPFASGINPHVDLAQSRSVQWAREVGLIGDERALVRLDHARVAHLSALVFRTASLEVLELVAQWTTLFCILDDHIESRRTGTMQLAAYLGSLLSGFESPGDVSGDCVRRAFGSLKTSLLELGGEHLATRFAAELERLFDGYLWEEFYRQTNSIPDFGAYRAIRLVTIGLRPQFLLSELEGHRDATREVRMHPAIVAMEDSTCRAVGWANDIFTHAKELELGEPHNLVGVLMLAQSLSRRQAVDRALALHDGEVSSLLHAAARLPDFGVLEEAARLHIQHLQHWIRGHLDWAVQTGRYSPRP